MNPLKQVQDLIRSDQPARLSRELRTSKEGYLPQRRGIVVTSLVASGAMGVITLYQMGLIEHLPDPPLPHMNASKVDAAEQAYARLSMPDAPIGLRSYATTLGLAAMGGGNRVEQKPWLPLLLAGKSVVDAFQAAKLTVDQWRKHRALCVWCLLAALATFVALPLALPEARAAFQRLLDEKQNQAGGVP